MTTNILYSLSQKALHLHYNTTIFLVQVIHSPGSFRLGNGLLGFVRRFWFFTAGRRFRVVIFSADAALVFARQCFCLCLCSRFVIVVALLLLLLFGFVIIVIALILCTTAFSGPGSGFFLSTATSIIIIAIDLCFITTACSWRSGC